MSKKVHVAVLANDDDSALVHVHEAHDCPFGEVVYEDKSGPSVGYSPTYAANWDKTFGTEELN